MTANHIECQACRRPVRRGDAVIRGDLHDQRGWHPECYTFHRATKDIPAHVPLVGGTLSERMALARAGAR